MFQFFEPFRPHLHSQFVKSANMIKTDFFFQKTIWASINAEFVADIDKIVKSDRKMESLTFITVCKFTQ
jgi:hypothetical protein